MSIATYEMHDSLPYTYATGVTPPLEDRIVYLLVTEGGGVDGLDHTDKGGVVVMASFDKAAVEAKKGLDSRYRIERRVVDEQDRRRALAKLDKIDRLLLNLPA